MPRKRTYSRVVAYPRSEVKMKMTHASKKARAKLDKASRAQLIAMLIFLLNFLKLEAGSKAYKKAESELGLSGRAKARGRGSSSRQKVHIRRRGPPKGKVPPQLRKYLFKKGHGKIKKKR